MTRLLADRLLPIVDGRRLTAGTLDPRTRTDLGQIFTPGPVAQALAAMFDLAPGADGRLLDPGAGVGTLTAAFVDRWQRAGGGNLASTLVEVDRTLQVPLTETVGELEARGVRCDLVFDDFVRWGLDRRMRRPDAGFTHAILNPPYQKLNRTAAARVAVADAGVDVPNSYAAFIAVTLRLLRPGGQMVAIVPRSWTNGPYFRAFRHDLLDQVSLRSVHLFDERDSVFADSGVLQENVILHAIKGGHRGTVRITSSAAADDTDLVVREVPHGEVVNEYDPERFVRLTVDELAAQIAATMTSLPCSLDDLGLTVSTGKVVDFRVDPDDLHADPVPGDAPLIYPHHLRSGTVRWPVKSRKSNGLAVGARTRSLLLPAGTYTVTKRFTAKEERRRVVAVVTPADIASSEYVAFENHVNVFHQAQMPLDEDLAVGLAAFLNTTAVDQYFRSWSGHTQVNATDLRSLRYPTKSQLEALGRAVRGKLDNQAAVDAAAQDHVPELSGGGGVAVVAHERVRQASDALRQLGLPREQQNLRSALTLLALLDLRPSRSWAQATNPMLGVTPIMDWMAEHYGKRYAPNSRETVRRRTIHQFLAAGIVVQNPDDPERPVNSKDNVYQVPDELLAVLQGYGSDAWDGALARWLDQQPKLVERWERERIMTQVPVTLPNNQQILLTPGGQNPLIKAILEDFCPHWIQSPHVIYIGDAGQKWAVWDQEAFSDLGISIDEHGKMPDVVVVDREREWLVVVEAVTSHGPVDAKRHDELEQLFAGSKFGIVYVTAFLDRASCARFLPEIDWETEVWVADAPTHMIHFDGERFLGPYQG